jgi:hypothetical protein
MSSRVSGITKVFSSIGTGAAALGSAVRGVGASLFTAGAATGSSVAAQAASGGTGILAKIFGSGSTLGNMLSGAANIMAAGPAGAVTAAMAAPAAAVTGATGLGANVASATEPLVNAATPTGLAPTGLGSTVKGFWEGLGPEGKAGLLQGLGSGIASYQESKTYEDQKNADRQYLINKDKNITESYNVPMSALAGGTPTVKAKVAWKYNPQNGQIETVAA